MARSFDHWRVWMSEHPAMYSAEDHTTEFRRMQESKALARCKTDLARKVLANEFARSKAKFGGPKKKRPAIMAPKKPVLTAELINRRMADFRKEQAATREIYPWLEEA